MIAHPQFYFIFPEEHQSPPFTDTQFKRFINEFLDILEESNEHIDDLIGCYPIIDLAFTYLFRWLLIFNKKAATVNEFVDRK